MDLGSGNWGFRVLERECVVDGVWMSHATLQLQDLGFLGSEELTQMGFVGQNGWGFNWIGSLFFCTVFCGGGD